MRVKDRKPYPAYRGKRKKRMGIFAYCLCCVGVSLLVLALFAAGLVLMPQRYMADETSGNRAAPETTARPWSPEAIRTPEPSPEPEPEEEATPVPAAPKLHSDRLADAGARAIERGVDPNGKMIALTFDDGPNPSNTSRVVKAISEAGGRATFFMLGENAAAYPETVRKVEAAGNLIASHTNAHKSLIRLSADEMTAEIRQGLDAVESVCGIRPTLLRPPYGNVNDLVRETVKMPMINWSVDTLDWQSRDAEKVCEEILANTRDGDIVLMHDIYQSTAEAVETVTPKLVDRGFQLVTVEELFALKGLDLESGKVYYSGR